MASPISSGENVLPACDFTKLAILSSVVMRSGPRRVRGGLGVLVTAVACAGLRDAAFVLRLAATRFVALGVVFVFTSLVALRAYNFIKIHRTLRTSPAMAAGVMDRLWDVSDIVELLQRAESKKAA
jgi:hypothetical protein